MGSRCKLILLFTIVMDEEVNIASLDQRDDRGAGGIHQLFSALRSECMAGSDGWNIERLLIISVTSI
jgi:hypothetical protein